jgi:hypothetical protein
LPVVSEPPPDVLTEITAPCAFVVVVVTKPSAFVVVVALSAPPLDALTPPEPPPFAPGFGGTVSVSFAGADVPPLTVLAAKRLQTKVAFKPRLNPATVMRKVLIAGGYDVISIPGQRWPDEFRSVAWGR